MSPNSNHNSSITSIAAYLQALRAALRHADPALVQDALYDAEEYLRAACAERPEQSEAEVLAAVLPHFGSPEEVAASYRDTETTVARALRPPQPKPPRSLLGKVFGVYADPYAYASVFYMLLTLATGIFYFTWAVTGVSMSAGFAILIIGIPFFLLFIGSVRLISLVEGRLVEVLLGERMPRRPLYSTQAGAKPVSIGQRILTMLKDLRTWSTLLYMVLMLPVGIAYFSAVVVGLTTSFVLMLAPFNDRWFYHAHGHIELPFLMDDMSHWPYSLLLVPLGFLLLTAVMHVARLIGRLHGKVAKQLLVQVAG